MTALDDVGTKPQSSILRPAPDSLSSTRSPDPFHQRLPDDDAVNGRHQNGTFPASVSQRNALLLSNSSARFQPTSAYGDSSRL